MSQEKKLTIHVFLTKDYNYWAGYHSSKGTAVYGATRKTRESAKQSFTALMNELHVPRNTWKFYSRKT